MGAYGVLAARLRFSKGCCINSIVFSCVVIRCLLTRHWFVIGFELNTLVFHWFHCLCVTTVHKRALTVCLRLAYVSMLETTADTFKHNNTQTSFQPTAQSKDPQEKCKNLQDLSKVAAEADQQSGTTQATQEAKKPTTGNKAEIMNDIK